MKISDFWSFFDHLSLFFPTLQEHKRAGLSMRRINVDCRPKCHSAHGWITILFSFVFVWNSNVSIQRYLKRLEARKIWNQRISAPFSNFFWRKSDLDWDSKVKQRASDQKWLTMRAGLEHCNNASNSMSHYKMNELRFKISMKYHKKLNFQLNQRSYSEIGDAS